MNTNSSQTSHPAHPRITWHSLSLSLFRATPQSSTSLSRPPLPAALSSPHLEPLPRLARRRLEPSRLLPSGLDLGAGEAVFQTAPGSSSYLAALQRPVAGAVSDVRRRPTGVCFMRRSATAPAPQSRPAISGPICRGRTGGSGSTGRGRHDRSPVPVPTHPVSRRRPAGRPIGPIVRERHVLSPSQRWLNIETC